MRKIRHNMPLTIIVNNIIKHHRVSHHLVLFALRAADAPYKRRWSRPALCAQPRSQPPKFALSHKPPCQQVRQGKCVSPTTHSHTGTSAVIRFCCHPPPSCRPLNSPASQPQLPGTRAHPAGHHLTCLPACPPRRTGTPHTTCWWGPQAAGQAAELATHPALRRSRPPHMRTHSPAWPTPVGRQGVAVVVVALTLRPITGHAPSAAGHVAGRPSGTLQGLRGGSRGGGGEGAAGASRWVGRGGRCMHSVKHMTRQAGRHTAHQEGTGTGTGQEVC